MGKYHAVGHRAEQESERHRRVTRVDQCPLALDKNDVVIGPFDIDEFFGCAADKIRHNPIDTNTSFAEHDSRLSRCRPRGPKTAPPRLFDELNRRCHLPHITVGACHENHARTRPAPTPRPHLFHIGNKTDVPYI